MRQKTITLYQFNELTDKAKEKARQWYREANADDSFWSEHILTEDAPVILKHLGYSAPEIYYSGFSSQGDGACFSGTWDASDCKPAALKAYAPEDTELNRIADAFAVLIVKHNDMNARLSHSGHYYHEHSISYNLQFSEEDLDNGGTQDFTDAENEFEELSRDLMRWIYRTLETEYEYQNSDEQIEETITANEYEFDVDGNRI